MGQAASHDPRSHCPGTMPTKNARRAKAFADAHTLCLPRRRCRAQCLRAGAGGPDAQKSTMPPDIRINRPTRGYFPSVTGSVATPDRRRRPETGHLEGWVTTQIVELVTIRVAACDGKDAAARGIGHRMGNLSGGAAIGDQPDEGVGQAKMLAGGGEQKHTTVRTDPLSNAAATFFLQIFGKENGRTVSSLGAGTANSVRGARVASSPNL